MSASEPASDPRPARSMGARKYGWFARRLDRFHGWLDGFQHRPDVTSDDVRTAYWHRLWQWAASLHSEERQRFLVEYGPAMERHQRDSRVLASLRGQLDKLEAEHRRAQDALEAEEGRLDAMRDPQKIEDYDARRRRRHQLYDFEKRASDSAHRLEQARLHHCTLESELERLATVIKLGEEMGRNSANQVWGFAKQRINVYCQSLVRSHPNGLVLERRLSQLATDPPTFVNGIGAGPNRPDERERG